MYSNYILFLIFYYVWNKSINICYAIQCPCDKTLIDNNSTIKKNDIAIIDNICIIMSEEHTKIYSIQMETIRLQINQVIYDTAITKQFNISIHVLQYGNNKDNHFCILYVSVIDDYSISSYKERFDMRWKQYLNCPGKNIKLNFICLKMISNNSLHLYK